MSSCDGEEVNPVFLRNRCLSALDLVYCLMELVDETECGRLVDKNYHSIFLIIEEYLLDIEKGLKRINKK